MEKGRNPLEKSETESERESDLSLSCNINKNNPESKKKDKKSKRPLFPCFKKPKHQAPQKTVAPSSNNTTKAIFYDVEETREDTNPAAKKNPEPKSQFYVDNETKPFVNGKDRTVQSPIEPGLENKIKKENSETKTNLETQKLDKRINNEESEIKKVSEIKKEEKMDIKGEKDNMRPSKVLPTDELHPTKSSKGNEGNELTNRNEQNGRDANIGAKDYEEEHSIDWNKPKGSADDRPLPTGDKSDPLSKDATKSNLESETQTLDPIESMDDLSKNSQTSFMSINCLETQETKSIENDLLKQEDIKPELVTLMTVIKAERLSDPPAEEDKMYVLTENIKKEEEKWDLIQEMKTEPPLNPAQQTQEELSFGKQDKNKYEHKNYAEFAEKETQIYPDEGIYVDGILDMDAYVQTIETQTIEIQTSILILKPAGRIAPEKVEYISKEVQTGCICDSDSSEGMKKQKVELAEKNNLNLQDKQCQTDICMCDYESSSDDELSV